MRLVARVLVSALLLTLAGCPETNVPGADTGPPIDALSMREDSPSERADAFAERLDAFVVVPDAPTDDAPLASPDAYVTEPCDVPGRFETVVCGRCGSAERFCTSSRVWEYGACSEPAGTECEAGSTGMAPCGERCGSGPARCDETCHWVSTGTCVEAGECSPGTSERTTMGCMGGATRGRTCGASCTWGMYAECIATPDDFDSDGVPYAMDCDDTDSTIVLGTAQPCGRFVCAGSPRRVDVPGTRTCMGPGWSVCSRPAGCTEPPACTGFESETRTCSTSGCDDAASETRSCAGSAWGRWSGCAAGRARPASCDPVLSSCGACAEGVAFSMCDASCRPSMSDCIGGGCTPGTRRRSTMGCAMGTYRETVCDAMCDEGLPGPCIPFRPEVDVMLLVDNTGSHTSLVMENAARLATELVGGLLADADVRVGVASFADFPRGSYGSSPDEPFRGILAPTADMAMITTALTGIASRSGGDGPESGIEALHVLAGGTPHPDSFPFMCPAGLAAGGCWRASAQRAVVMITDITQHNIPQVAGGMPVDPYAGFTPLPPTWTAARTQMISSGLAFFAIVPESGPFGGGFEPPSQMRFIATELAQDPDASIAVYPSSTRDLTTSARSMVVNLRAYLGLTP